MKRTLQLMMMGMLTLGAVSPALAVSTGGGDPGPGDPPPPPPSFSHSATAGRSYGGSLLGLTYNTSVGVYSNLTSKFEANGYAHALGTLVGTSHSLANVGGIITAQPTSYSAWAYAYVGDKQLFDVSDTRSTAFTRSWAYSYKSEIWSNESDWTVLGTGVTLRLALDGGVDLGGTVALALNHASGEIKPRVWMDAGGELSASILWISVGSLSGLVHVIDGKADGTASIGLSGGKVAWSVTGTAQLCTLGGTLTACLPIEGCDEIVSWASYCPLSSGLSYQGSGTL